MLRGMDLNFLGSRARILAHAGEGAPLGVVDMLEVPPEHMPPLHVHHDHDEAFYMLDGTATLHMPDAEITIHPGDYVLAPRCVPHTYRVGEEPARWLVISHPAGFERFVAEVAAADASDPARLTAIAGRHGIEILGPPGDLP